MSADSGVVQETRGFDIIFIHSMIDDAGLTAAEFRVYAHLSRRASRGSAWPSVRSMAEICKINKDTVCAALDVLEKRGMIRREKRGFSSSVYLLTDPTCWLSETEGQSVRKEGTTPVRKEGTEGNPSEGNPLKEKKPSRLRATQQEIADFCVSIGLPASDGERTFLKWEGNGWKNRGDAIADWKATIRNWKLQGFMPSQKPPEQRNGTRKFQDHGDLI